MVNNSVVLIGAHLSIMGGLYKSIERATTLKCTALQIFTRSNRQWQAKELLPEEIILFKHTWATSNIRQIVVHANYLINIASADFSLQHKSIEALADELERCEKLGISYLVLHPGSAADGNKAQAIERAGKILNQALAKAQSSTTILLENMAGQGNALGNTFEELKILQQATNYPQRIQFCLDTCHAFAAGYDIRTEHTYKEFMHSVDATVGLHNIKAIHLNDSKKELNAHVDRHANVGAGYLGMESFKLFMNDPAFFAVPKILETPPGQEEKDLNALRECVSQKTQKYLEIV